MDYFKFVTNKNTVRLISMNNLIDLTVNNDYIEFNMINDDHITIYKTEVTKDSWEEFYKNFRGDMEKE